jgi:signal transduction histidine kinase
MAERGAAAGSGPAGSVASAGSTAPQDDRTTARNAYSRQLAASVRVDEVLGALSGALSTLLPADRGYFVRRADDGYHGVHAVGDHREVAENVVVTDPDDLDRALADGRCVPTDVTVDGTTIEVLAVPAGPASSGVLLLADGTASSSETSEDLAIAVASEAWATICRVEAVDELEGKVEILEAIAGVASSARLDLADVAARVTRHAALSLSCERAAMYLYDERTREPRLLAFHAADRDWTVEDEVVQSGELVARRLRDLEQPFLAQDVRTCDWLTGPWVAAEGAVSLYALPLRLAGDEIGVLVVAHTTANPRGFTSLCTQVGVALSQQAALAIANARLYDAQRQLTHDMRSRDQHRADYVAGLTHDLKSPITAILGFARTLRQSGDLLDPSDREEALATIERQSLRISRMLDDMLDAARAEAGELTGDRRVAVPLDVAVQEAVVIAGPEQRARLHPVEDPGVIVCGDPDQLTRVVQNLVVNALQYSPSDTPVEVVVSGHDDHGVVTVVDHGPGVPDSLDVFARYRRGEGHGTGLGLYTVKRIVELHGGSIALSATTGGGTTVTVRLPRYDPDRAC